jgi:hypothetical protein
VQKKITTLTPEQIAQFGEWAKKWIDIGLSTEPADFDRATSAALRAYELCNLKKPMVVLRVGSPYAATLAGAYAWMLLKNLKGAQVGDQVGAQVGDQVWDQVRDQVWDQVWAQVGDQVRDQVRAQVGDQVGAQVGAQVGDQVGAQVGDQVWDQVRDQVWAQVRDQVGDQVGDQVWAQVGDQVGAQVWDQVRASGFAAAKDGINNEGPNSLWASFAAYVTFLRDVCGWDGSTLEKFAVNEELVRSCGWTWWHENILVISDRPSEIHRDQSGLLHGEKGPSIAYRDGWSLHHWHGVKIPGEWVTGKPPSATEALTWANVEQRRAACEIVGWANVLSELNARVIDEDGDEEIGTLLEADIPDSGKERFLKVRCGTSRVFCLPVPREMKSAIQANAWTYGLDPADFQPEVRT